MSLLYQSAGFFTQNKMKMIQRSDVHYVIINITTNGFEFVGTNFNLPNFHKDSTGFRFDVPWSCKSLEFFFELEIPNPDVVCGSKGRMV